MLHLLLANVTLPDFTFLALKFILWVVFTWKVRLPTLVTLEGSG